MEYEGREQEQNSMGSAFTEKPGGCSRTAVQSQNYSRENTFVNSSVCLEKDKYFNALRHSHLCSWGNGQWVSSEGANAGKHCVR